MMKTAELLDDTRKNIIAVIGCGGKTSLIAKLARDFYGQGYKVLVSPTTKMFPLHIAGVDNLGVLNPASGKLEALPAAKLTRLIPQYDLILLEADGSRSLPCKGWAGNEPIIPSFCTGTIGIITLNGLGKAAAAEVVLHLPEFLELTGLHKGESITMDHLLKMVCAPRGMFKNSVGSSLLLVNQVEDEQTAGRAREFLEMVKEHHPGRFAGLLYGSVFQDHWTQL